jgi:predicted dehydrogenase
MPERLRCGVIGTGAFGCDHLGSLLHCPRGTAVALAEPHPGRAREASDRYRISRSYSDYHDLLDQPDIDAVTIAVPNHLHAQVALDALEARKHVLLEKPMATHARDAQRLVDAARKAKRTLMVAQNLRFHRHTQIARLALDRGDLGEVYHARTFWLRRSGIPRNGSWFTQQARAGGGCLIDLGVHMLDLALHLLGEFEVRSVCAHTAARFGPRNLGQMDWGRSEIDPKHPFDVEDHGVALLRLKSGRTLLLEVSWAGHHAGDQPEQGVQLLGTEGGLGLFPARRFRPGSDGYETVHLAAAPLPHSEDRIHHFVSCVLDGRKPLVAPEESLKVQRALDALYASAGAGKEVRLDPA